MAFEVASFKQHVFANTGVVNIVERRDPQALASEPTRRYSEHLTTIKSLIALAYDIQANQMVGLPQWAENRHEYYDVDAIAPVERPTVLQLRQMMQTLLKERCSLEAHQDKQVLPVYELTVSKTGPKFSPISGEPTRISSSMFSLVRELSIQVEYRIIDRTGLTGYYHFPGLQPILLESRNSGFSFPALFSERYGLDLKLKKESMDVLVVDHIQRPSQN